MVMSLNAKKTGRIFCQEKERFSFPTEEGSLVQDPDVRPAIRWHSVSKSAMFKTKGDAVYRDHTQAVPGEANIQFLDSCYHQV